MNFSVVVISIINCLMELRQLRPPCADSFDICLPTASDGGCMDGAGDASCRLKKALKKTLILCMS